MDWFLYDNGPRHERVKVNNHDTRTNMLTLFGSQFILLSANFVT